MTAAARRLVGLVRYPVLLSTVGRSVSSALAAAPAAGADPMTPGSSECRPGGGGGGGGGGKFGHKAAALSMVESAVIIECDPFQIGRKRKEKGKERRSKRGAHNAATD